MSADPLVEELFLRFVEHHVSEGKILSAQDLCRGNEDLLEPLQRCIRGYLALDQTLDQGTVTAPEAPERDKDLPIFDGFQTIERIGGGGMGEVFKLRDRKLDRIVAGKVIRPDARVHASLSDFLREAKAMALFQDSRIVQVHEFRDTADPPVIIMEYVDGFQLSQVGPSLEYAQRARIVKGVCEALHRAHSLGIQHRDLKPANIMLDAALQPKILDFGLSESDPGSGHLKGTLHYLAPEQLDPTRRIDARTDVYALGVILYELISGSVPYDGDTVVDLLPQLEAGQPRLPVEWNSGVPEPLQAIALKAMERDPGDRYPSTREMALDLERYLDGRPVLARPSLYSSALGRRLQPHLEQIEEWQRLKLIYPHEARRLRLAYRRLQAREDDWIVESRTLSYSQIALYLGALFLVVGSLLYFGAHRFFEAVEGLLGPLLVLGLPFAGLNAASHVLYRKGHRAVAVAFSLGAVLLLPLLLLILFHEGGLWLVTAGDEGQFFVDGPVSNRQMQVALLIACVWAVILALRTGTTALSAVATLLVFFLNLAVLTDLDLRIWLEEGRWDLLSFHLMPLLLLMALAGHRMEAGGRPWFARPLYVGAVVVLVTSLELLALDGKAFRYLGLSMRGYQSPDVGDPILLDTLTAMTLTGMILYVVASLLEWRGTEVAAPASFLLFALSPFATLEPVAYLNLTEEYSRSFGWLFLVLALTVSFLSHHRQRKTFYLAGLLNTVLALWLITTHYEWFDEPTWAMVVIVVGLVVLAAGFQLYRYERTRRRVGSS